MKLFGKRLFGHKKRMKPEFMYDFAQHGLLNNGAAIRFDGLIQMDSPNPVQKKKRGRPPKDKVLITPKSLHAMKALNKNEFAIGRDPEYLREQIWIIDEKLSLFAEEKSGQELEFGGTKYGRRELEDIKTKLQNRKKMDNFKKILDKYPHTTSALMSEVVEKYDHLECGKADTFVPDFPKEAIKAMKEYNEMCKLLTNMKTNFYVLANKKDFQKVDKKRDPILFAQSPFGHFWQILGAWDKEMQNLSEL